MDALFTAARAALHNTRIPLTIPTILADGTQDYELSDDLASAHHIYGYEKVPITMTMNVISQNYIVDATLSEEACSSSRLIVAVNRDGGICGIRKGGEGGITGDLISEMVDRGKELGVEVIKKLDSALERENEKMQHGSNSKVGFFA